MKKSIIFVAAIILFCGTLYAQFNDKLTYGEVKDFEGNTYKTIQIGTQTWMAENLRTSTYSNGLPIENIIDHIEFGSYQNGAWVHFSNNPSYNIPYGKLYNWYAVINTNQICPSGWHIPTDSEWTTLTTFLGGESVAGGKMKSTGKEYWQAPNTGATNSSGFSGLPAGSGPSDPKLGSVGSYGIWWGLIGNVAAEPAFHRLSYNNKKIEHFNTSTSWGLSIRCIKN